MLLYCIVLLLSLTNKVHILSFNSNDELFNSFGQTHVSGFTTSGDLDLELSLVSVVLRSVACVLAVGSFV